MRRLLHLLLASFLLAVPALAAEKPAVPETARMEQVKDLPKPFLVYPIPVGVEVVITEGEEYSAEEQGKHGFKAHWANDSAVKLGTPVVAPTSGWAIASYQSYRLPNGLGFGLGIVIKIWDPVQDVHVVLAHLDSHKNVLYLPPVQNGKNWDPDNAYFLKGETLKAAGATYVTQGTVIGTVGVSGLAEVGETELPPGHPQFKGIPPSWDEPHLHLEVYRREGKEAKKPEHRYDALGVYSGDIELYNKVLRGEVRAPRGIFLLDQQGKPLHVKVTAQ